MKIVQMFCGVAAGILLSLFLTLSLWGSETYQIIISVMTGVTFGLWLAGPKEAREIFSEACRRLRLFNQVNDISQGLFRKGWRFIREVGLIGLASFSTFMLVGAYYALASLVFESSWLREGVWGNGVLSLPISWNSVMVELVSLLLFMLSAAGWVDTLMALFRLPEDKPLPSVASILMMAVKKSAYIFRLAVAGTINMVILLAAMPVGGSLFILFAGNAVAKRRHALIISLSIIIGSAAGIVATDYIIGLVSGLLWCGLSLGASSVFPRLDPEIFARAPFQMVVSVGNFVVRDPRPATGAAKS